MNNDKNPMNETTSSWTTENMNNDVQRYYQNKNNFKKEKIDKGAYGEKYILEHKDDTNEKLFSKYDTSQNNELQENEKTNHQISLLSQALNSAFISCFSHTPYPVGISYEDNKPFVIWRFDEKDESVKKIESDFTDPTSWANDDLRNIFYYSGYIANQKHLQQAIKNKNINKAMIQLNVQQFFFEMHDRHYDNIIIKNNRFSHIDHVDANTKKNDLFLYSMLFNKETLSNFAELFNSHIMKDKQNLTIAKNQIKKIQNINYDLFVERYIRNCLVLGIKEEDALNSLTKFVNHLLKHAKEHKETKPDIKDIFPEIFEEKNNEYYNLLEEGYKQYLVNLQNNKTLKDITENNYEKQFNKLFKECKKKYVYKENQNVLPNKATLTRPEKNNVCTKKKTHKKRKNMRIQQHQINLAEEYKHRWKFLHNRHQFRDFDKLDCGLKI